jgi:hypothetical protein
VRLKLRVHSWFSYEYGIREYVYDVLLRVGMFFSWFILQNPVFSLLQGKRSTAIEEYIGIFLYLISLNFLSGWFSSSFYSYSQVIHRFSTFFQLVDNFMGSLQWILQKYEQPTESTHIELN